MRPHLFIWLAMAILSFASSPATADVRFTSGEHIFDPGTNVFEIKPDTLGKKRRAPISSTASPSSIWTVGRKPGFPGLEQ